MAEIRRLSREELEDSLALSEFAFQAELTRDERDERLAMMEPEHIWGFFEEGRLAAKLTILKLRTWLHGKAFAMGGIAGVATWPEHRRKGMVGQLLRQALQTMRDNGQTLSFIAPFKFEFYRKYGWETYIEYLKYEIPAAKLPRFQAPEGGSIVRLPRSGEPLNAIYEAYARRYNGMLQRSEEWWRQRYFQKHKKGFPAVYRNPQGEATGYVFYDIKNRVCSIHEFVFLDEQARQALWKFIADHDSMLDKAILQAPVDDALAFLVDDPRFKQEKEPYFMARIVDAEAFMAQYPFAASEPAAAEPLYIDVQDAYAPWNEALFELDIRGSGVRVRKCPAGQNYGQSRVLRCSIQTLTALLMGYQKASLLHSCGRIQGDERDIQLLESIVPPRTTYLADFF